MKKNRLLSLFLALVMLFGVVSALGGSAMAADVAINKTNFPDANFREFVERYDTNNNGSLSAAELAAEDKMDCNNRNIANLKGIEYFTALTYLRCDKNLLTSLDVSRNTALTELNCDDNKLTSLVVSRNTALTTLECSSNQLTSLDVSRNTALTFLNCNNNQLTSLDVSRNTALTGVNCDNNLLTSLDVSHNTALTYLYCNGNQLTSLDVSRNTALTKLQCYSNKLTNLDVSRNTALTKLYCYNNLLTSLDVGAVPAIRDAVVNGKKEVIFTFYCYESGQGALWVDRTVTIVTDHPTLTGSAAISPSNPKVGDTLTVYLSGSAWAIPNAKLHFQWQYYDSSVSGGTYRDISGATNKTYVSNTPGRQIRVKVTADGYEGVLYSSSVTMPGEIQYLSGSVSISPSNPKVGDTLNASIRISNDGYSGRTLCQWQRSVGSSDFENIPGATGDTYKPVQDDAGKKIRLAVFNNNYDGYIFSEPVTVAKDPTGLYGTVTVSPSNPKAGDKLTSSLSGNVAGISVRNLKYQWQQSTNTGSFSNIRQATGSTYTVPASAPDGRQYRLVVTATGYTGTLYSNIVTVGTSSYPKGDVDRSGQVGNSDLIMVARHVVHILTLTGEQFTLGDMDNDNVIDNKDIISVARKVVGL